MYCVFSCNQNVLSRWMRAVDDPSLGFPPYIYAIFAFALNGRLQNSPGRIGGELVSFVDESIVIEFKRLGHLRSRKQMTHVYGWPADRALFDKMGFAVNCLLYALLNRYICDRITDNTLPRNLIKLDSGLIYFTRSYLKCPDFTIYPTFTEIYVNSPYLVCGCVKKLPTQRVTGCLPRSVTDYAFASTMTSIVPRSPVRRENSYKSSPVWSISTTSDSFNSSQIPPPTESLKTESKSRAWIWVLIVVCLCVMAGSILCVALCVWIRSGVPRAAVENIIGVDKDTEPSMCQESIQNSIHKVSWVHNPEAGRNEGSIHICM